MKNMDKSEHLPRPTLMHHIVEDFLTHWDAPVAHILPLRRFVENVVNQDMRIFYADDCMVLALTNQNVPYRCKGYLEGAGLGGREFLSQMASRF